ncbi:MAG TPA: M48 family metalloprotease, partial [Burkholderiaceae bacterium]|nr:M48 family metalloprotease [Burkholderiaceae bacterium]
MNFFEHQHLARRNTRRLSVLFALAVIAMVLSVNVVALWLWRWCTAGSPLPPYFIATNTVVVLGLVLGGTLLETWRLRAGGEEVARMVGARLVARDTTHEAERRLINIVEEMSLASGVTVPRVYLMEHEASINAFAAGFSPNDAVIAVTRGTLERLNRDELQGVVAHEFSHILNGDMALNLRLIGLVYGLLLVALFGKQLMSISG